MRPNADDAGAGDHDYAGSRSYRSLESHFAIGGDVGQRVRKLVREKHDGIADHTAAPRSREPRANRFHLAGIQVRVRKGLGCGLRQFRKCGVCSDGRCGFGKVPPRRCPA